MVRHALVTGGAGFIGSNLVELLVGDGNWKITVVDDLSTGSLGNLEKVLDDNLLDFKPISIFDLTTVKPFDVIFHLAALPRIQPSFESPIEHLTSNVATGLHILELMRKEQHFPRIIYSSSSAVYGNPNEIPTSENALINPLNPYAFQKYEFEKYLEIMSTRYPINYCSLRYFNPYGPRSFNKENPLNAYSSVVGIFLNQHAEGRPLTITGDGSQRRDFIHVSDVAKANLLCANHTGELPKAMNIGSGVTFSVVEVATLIGGKFEYIPARGSEAQITFADISKVSKTLKWEPEKSLENYVKEQLKMGQ
jgi:UDP-glucose 4-epimerase